jgi:hypothetical protein
MAHPPAMHVVARQCSRPDDQLRQSAPGLSVKVQNAVEKFFQDMTERAVDMGGLSAGMAIGPAQLLSAIGARRVRLRS